VKLYEIDLGILECLDDETGEVLDMERLTALTMERNEKIINVACWFKNLRAEAEAIKAERDNLTERLRIKNAKADGLKDWLAYAADGQKFDTPRVQIGWRKSDSVSFTDERAIPDRFKEQVIEIKISKDDIKRALKAGETVPGAEIVSNNNIQIK